MKIIPSVMIVIPASGVTGPAKGIFQQLIHYKKKPGNFYLYNFRLPGEKENEDIFLNAGNSIGLKINYIKQNKRLDYGILNFTKKDAKKKGINIFQSHGFKPGVIGWYLKSRIGIKWVCFMHGNIVQDFKLRIYNVIDNFIQLFADKVILVCEAQRKKILGGNNRKRVQVINNGIDLKNPVNISQSPKFVRESLGIKNSEKIIVCISRFSYEKGLDLLVNIFPTIVAKNQKVYAIIVGDGPLREQIEILINKVNMKDRIKTVGYSIYPGDYIQIADAVVLPSRSEGMPNVILEALALGKPVVATDVGGVKEIIQNNINGLVVESENSEALGDAILKVLSDIEFTRRISETGLQVVKRNFSSDDRAEKIYNVYLDLLK